MVKEQSLITKIIIGAIIIIPIIICIVNEFKYKDLGYEEGEFTGYILEVKCYRDTTSYAPGTEIHFSSSRAKQSYNIKENDYISESLEKNLQVTDDIKVQVEKNTIKSYNRTIVTIKQLNETDANIKVLGINGYEQISLKYGKSYKMQLGDSRYTIKLKKVY